MTRIGIFSLNANGILFNSQGQRPDEYTHFQGKWPLVSSNMEKQQPLLRRVATFDA
jgi:hypothetical protein